MAMTIHECERRLVRAVIGRTAVLCLLLTGCVQSPAGDPSGQLVRRSDCKGSQGLSAGGGKSAAAGAQECAEYDYDGRSVLLLKHVNAGFNCCPGTISADIRIEDGTIRVKESESSAMCCCDCLYDLDYKCVDLKPGFYKITILNPYQPESGPLLEFTVDLRSAASGKFCVDRTQYPWGY